MEQKENNNPTCELRQEGDKQVLEQSQLMTDEEKEKLEAIRKQISSMRRRRSCCG